MLRLKHISGIWFNLLFFFKKKLVLLIIILQLEKILRFFVLLFTFVYTYVFYTESLKKMFSENLG